MAVTITHQPNGLILAKNPAVHFAGQTDNTILTPGVKQYVSMVLANQCNYDFTMVFTFLNKLGVNILSRTFNFPGYTRVDRDLVNDYFIPEIVNVLNSDSVIAQYFNVSYVAAFAAILLEIEAKETGEKYKLNVSVNFSPLFDDYNITSEGVDPSGLFSMTYGADIAYRDDLIIQCAIQQYDFTSNIWNTKTKLKCIPTKDAGSFLFNVAGAVASCLNNTISMIKPAPQDYRQFGFFRFEFDEVIAGIPQNTTYIHESYAILGASPQPNRSYDTNRFFYDEKHQFLTNMPPRTRFGRDVYFPFGFMLGNAFSKAQVFYRLNTDATSLQFTSESKTAEIKPYFFKYAQANYAAAFEDILNLDAAVISKDECTLLIWNEHYNDAPTYAMGNQLEVIIDLKKYRNNNYFLFSNALGATDVAWLSGELEMETEVDGTKIEHVPMLDADFQEAQYSMMNKKGVHRFKISTGYKSVAEIQWLLELVYSESILWAPHRVWRSMIAAARNTIDLEAMEAPFPIIIDKQSVSYYKSNGTVNSFSFEFEIAADNCAPHINLI